jgi:hypothetical protein
MGDAFLRWADRRWLIGHSKGYDVRRLMAVFGSDILPCRRVGIPGAVVVRLQEHRAVSLVVSPQTPGLVERQVVEVDRASP